MTIFYLRAVSRAVRSSKSFRSFPLDSASTQLHLHCQFAFCGRCFVPKSYYYLVEIFTLQCEPNCYCADQHSLLSREVDSTKSSQFNQRESFPQSSKVLRILGRRPLLRTGVWDLYMFAGNAPNRWAARRFQTTWTQDIDDVADETGAPRLSGRIHILGVGNVGMFVAHSLMSRQSPPPITLLLHHKTLFRSYIGAKGCLAVQTNGLDDIKTGFDVNMQHRHTKWLSVPHMEEHALEENALEGGVEHIPVEEQVRILLDGAEQDNDTIECLVLAVKAPQACKALWSVKHRLTRDSTICLIHNGMGIIEEINKKVFPDPLDRPHYMVGIFSHALSTNGPFQVSHNGVGTTILSPVPSRDAVAPANDKDADWAPTTKYMLRIMTLTPPLVAFAETPASILQYQLEKLAMNAVINPLTSVMECKNGELLYNYQLTRVMRLLLIEISGVICALPELQGIPGVETRFSPERLRRMVVQLASKTGNNRSSMLQDVLERRATEIDYINGYIVRRGEELGIKCVVNYMLQQMVLGRQRLMDEREAAAIPMDLRNFKFDENE